MMFISNAVFEHSNNREREDKDETVQTTCERNKYQRENNKSKYKIVFLTFLYKIVNNAIKIVKDHYIYVKIEIYYSNNLTQKIVNK